MGSTKSHLKNLKSLLKTIYENVNPNEHHNDFILEQQKLQTGKKKHFKIEIIYSAFIKYEWRTVDGWVA